MHVEILGSFPDYTIFIWKFIHETILVYKLETFENCKEVKDIMIKIITIIYVFLSYVLFDQQLKITFRKSPPPPPEKIHSPLKVQKVQDKPPFLPTLKIFQPFHPPPPPPPPPPPCRKRGGRTLWTRAESH